MGKAEACAITNARQAIDDAMPRECFPDPKDADRFFAMVEGKNAASAAIHAMDMELKSRLGGMSEAQALRAWHSICSYCLFNLESAVAAYDG